MIKAILKITTNPKVWVQWCHFSLGYSTFLFTYLFHGNLWIAAAVFMPFTAYKELWIDPHDESHTNGLPAPSGGKIVGKPDWDDLAFYWLGMVVILLLLRYTHHR